MIFIALSLIFITSTANPIPKQDKNINDDIITCNEYKECESKALTTKYTYCHGFQSCSEATIESLFEDGSIECTSDSSCTHSTMTAKGNIICNGASSCFLSPSLEANTIDCGGAYGCSFSNYMTANTIGCSAGSSCKNSHILATDTISCQGHKSCFSTDIHSENDIICDSHESCAESKLSAIHSIQCSTSQSCRSSDIKTAEIVSNGEWAAYKSKISASTVYGYGAYSLAQSIIDSLGEKTLEVEFYGYYSGMKATVICQSGSHCKILCKHNGCKQLNYLCFAGADCEVEPIQCNDINQASYHGIDCPLWSVSESVNDDELLMTKMEKIKQDNSYINIFGEHADEVGIVYEDMEDVHLSQDITPEDMSEDALFCGNNDMCLGKHIDSDYTYCFGHKSCSQATLIGLSSIECNGVISCSDIPEIITSSVHGEVSCNGYKSCVDIKRRIHSIYVQCNGKNSCVDTTIGSLMTISCHGESSCLGSTLISEKSDIVCTGYSSCSEAVLEGELDVLCSSTEACKNSQIASTTLRAYGLRSAVETEVYAAKVIGSGYYALSMAEIDSLGQRTMQVRLYGHNAGQYSSIICRAGSQCSVSCKSTGCYKSTFVCLAGSKCTVTPSRCSVDILDDEEETMVKDVDCPEWKQSKNVIEDIMLFAWLKQRKEQRKQQINDDLTYDQYVEELNSNVNGGRDDDDDDDKQFMDVITNELKAKDRSFQIDIDNVTLLGLIMFSVVICGLYGCCIVYERRGGAHLYEPIK